MVTLVGEKSELTLSYNAQDFSVNYLFTYISFPGKALP